MHPRGFRKIVAATILALVVAGLMTLPSSQADLSPLPTPYFIQVSRIAEDKDDRLYGVRSVEIVVGDLSEKHPSGLSTDMLKLLVARRVKDRSDLEVVEVEDALATALCVRVSTGPYGDVVGWAYDVEVSLTRLVIIQTGKVLNEGYGQGFGALGVKVWDRGYLGIVGVSADPVGTIEEGVKQAVDDFILAWYKANK